MKHLYIIGNGFDIFTGLKTSYQDFRRWLQIHYIFVYETFEAVYGIQNVEWWNDFEVSLGPLEKVCGYRSTIKILFCPFIKLNNG